VIVKICVADVAGGGAAPEKMGSVVKKREGTSRSAKSLRLKHARRMWMWCRIDCANACHTISPDLNTY
jgi:hypothetical protein